MSALNGVTLIITLLTTQLLSPLPLVSIAPEPDGPSRFKPPFFRELSKFESLSGYPK